jgi:hypothetical protein
MGFASDIQDFYGVDVLNRSFPVSFPVLGGADTEVEVFDTAYGIRRPCSTGPNYRVPEHILRVLDPEGSEFDSRLLGCRAVRNAATREMRGRKLAESLSLLTFGLSNIPLMVIDFSRKRDTPHDRVLGAFLRLYSAGVRADKTDYARR